MEVSERFELRFDAYYFLKKLSYDKKEGLAFMNTIVNGSDADYGKLDRYQQYKGKHDLKTLINNISTEIQDYVDECDKLSFDAKNELRLYSIKPYMSNMTLLLLDNFIDHAMDVFWEDNILDLEIKNTVKRRMPYEREIKNDLDSIIDNISSYYFVSDIEDCISYFDKCIKVEDQKI